MGSPAPSEEAEPVVDHDFAEALADVIVSVPEHERPNEDASILAEAYLDLQAKLARPPAPAPVDPIEDERPAPRPIGRCPKCGRDWYSEEGFCGGCAPYA